MVLGTGNISKRISHSTSLAETLSCAALIPLGQLVAMRIAEPELALKHGRLTPVRLFKALRAVRRARSPILMLK